MSAAYEFADLVYAFRLGYDYAMAPERIADLVDDTRNAPTLVPPSVPYEERVRQRAAEMEAFDVPAWFAEYRTWVANVDRRVILAGKRWPAMRNDWRMVKASVSDTVWRRIWDDFDDATRRRHLDLAPFGWRRGLAVVA